ncbi:MAG: endolytic transglycosylase MltG, partial [Bacteroidales bacterium]|nr:endolytic transglycosylase MltG [Bacteroidales bacterium]
MNTSLKVVICAVAGVAAIAVAVLATNLYRDKKAAGFRSSIELYIRDTTSPVAVEDSLKAHARWPRRIHRILKKESAGAPFKPGHYTVERSSTVTFAARMLTHGWQTPVKLTLSGSLRRKGDIAKKLSMQMMADSSSIAAALDDEELLAGLGVTPATAFALFIPDTYQFYWTETPEAILGRMKEAADAYASGMRKSGAGSSASLERKKRLLEKAIPDKVVRDDII